MICAIHQPQYLPWLGYFDKLDRADVFCYLDSVQYKKNEWQNRNRIRTARDWQWLTVPVHYRFPQSIDTVRIDHRTAWRRKHVQALKTHYARATHASPTLEAVADCLRHEWEGLADLNVALIERLRTLLGITGDRTCRSSRMDLPEEPSERLIAICRELGADTYLAGADGARYMDLDRFRRSGVKVVFQDFRHPVYPQCYRPFESHLSVVDLLMNCGPESLAVLRTGRATDGLSQSPQSSRR